MICKARNVGWTAWIGMFAVLVSQGARADSASWNALVESYFKDWFKLKPSQMSAAGLHDRDGELEDYSAKAVREEIRMLHDYEKKLEAFSGAGAQGLSPDQIIDQQMLLSTVQGELLDLEVVKKWQTYPDRYGADLGNSIFLLIGRKFAPLEERLALVVSREKKMPQVFKEARKNLKNPPRIFTQIALEQVEGAISFFRDDVPAVFKELNAVQGADKTVVQDAEKSKKLAPLLAEFKKSNDAVVAGLIDYQKYLKTQVLPRSKGEFKLGAKTYLKKLKLDEWIDLSVDQLLKVGQANLKENQDTFKQVAAMIDPQRTPKAILEELVHDHPKADGVIPAFKARTAEAKKFIEDHHIATIPSDVPPIIEETPSFERALFFASLDPAGPYETQAKEAYFNVTLPEAAWPADKTEEFLQEFNRGTILSTAIHEAYPGHYLQFIWQPQVASKVRKILSVIGGAGANANVEGWAHYCEQMMLEQGLGGNDPKLKLGQLQDALLRNARFMVSVKMHAGKMTYPEAIDYFVNEGYQSRTAAEHEARRGTTDPTYLYYTAGKLAILKLRDDYRKLKGAEYSLQKFHDDFLKQGAIPLPLMRKALLGSEGDLF